VWTCGGKGIEKTVAVVVVGCQQITQKIWREREEEEEGKKLTPVSHVHNRIERDVCAVQKNEKEKEKRRERGEHVFSVQKARDDPSQQFLLDGPSSSWTTIHTLTHSLHSLSTHCSENGTRVCVCFFWNVYCLTHSLSFVPSHPLKRSTDTQSHT
jgi:hypothetical protein